MNLALTKNCAVAVLLAALAPSLLANLPGGGTGAGANVVLTSSGTTATLSNGIISIGVSKTGARVSPINYTFNNTGTPQTVNVVGANPAGKPGELYWDLGGFGSGVFTYSVVVDPALGNAAHAIGDHAEIALLSTTANSGEVEIRYSMRRGSPGFYVTAIFRHRAQDAAMSMGEMRNNIYCGGIFNWLHADATKTRLFQTSGSFMETPTAPKECTLWTDGLYQGQYEDKYKYGVALGTLRAWGWSSVGPGKKNIGLWNVTASPEYYNGGPLKQELTCHLGTTLLNYFNGSHYGPHADGGFAAGEVWTKTYGPYLVYCNQISDTVTDPVQASQALYADALAQADAEKSAWPYAWFHHADYAPASARATVTGKLVVNDPFNPNATGAHAWVGLVRQPTTTTGIYDFQIWMKPYQFWVRANANGHFTIPHVLPGANYTLYAFGAGPTNPAGTFLSQPQTHGQPNISLNLPATPLSVTATAGATTALGEVIWTPTRVGPTVFEIGYPDRTARKFRHGEDYWVGDIGPGPTSPSPVWTKFLEYPFDFPNGVAYTVGTHRWTTDWNFVQPVVLDAAGNWNGSTSTITFHLASPPTSGSASLYVGQAANYAGNMIISVNGTNLGSSANTTSSPLANSSTGYANTTVAFQATVREGIYGAFSDNRITFPATLLRAGANTLTLNMRKSGYFGNNAMYDYLRLELAGYIPPAPTAVRAFAGNNRVLLNWPATPGATSYDILRSTTSGGGYVAIPNGTSVVGPVCGSGLSPGLVDTTAQNGTTYYYVVRSVNPVGISAYSAQSPAVTPTPAATTAAPAAPTDLSVTAGNRTATVSWSATPGASLYTVKRSTLFANGGGTFNNLGTITLADNVAATTYTDTSPTNGSLYAYTVSATNAAGPGPDSAASANTTPLAPAPTNAPANLTATALQTSSSGDITIDWSAAAGAKGYLVQRAISASGPYTLVASVSTPVTIDSGLTANTTYHYRVAAMNTGGTSAFVTASATTPPSAPASLTATGGSSRVRLDWPASSGATSYVVSRATTSGGPYTVIKTGVSNITYADRSVANGTTYYYAVAASGPGGTGANSTRASATPAGAPTLTWTGTTGTTWNTTAANWLNGGASAVFANGNAVLFDDTAGTATTVAISGTVTPDDVVFGHSSAYTFTAAGLSGATSLTKLGTGTLSISGVNTFSGGTIINEGVVVITGGTANSQNGLGTGLVTLDGGTLVMNGHTGSNGLPGYGTLANALSVPTTGTLRVSQRGAFTGTVTGGGTLTLQLNYVRGDLGGDWSGFTGRINAIRTRTGTNTDTFRINSATGFGTAAVHLGPYVQAHTLLNASRSYVIGELGGDANGQLSGINVSSAGTYTATYVVGGRHTDATFAGTIVNGASPSLTALTKVGAGTWTLSGTATHGGPTRVSAGTLAITGTLATPGSITVAGGATLHVTGALTAASVLIEEGGRLTGHGTLTGNVTNHGIHSVDTGGTFMINGDVTNHGAMRFVNGSRLAVTGAFANHGLLDLMTGGSQVLPFDFTNHGTVLLAADVVVKSFTKSGPMFTLTIDGHVAHAYQLQRGTTLQSGDWTNIGAPQNGAGAVLTFTDAPADTERVFYRIRVAP